MVIDTSRTQPTSDLFNAVHQGRRWRRAKPELITLERPRGRYGTSADERSYDFGNRYSRPAVVDPATGRVRIVA